MLVSQDHVSGAVAGLRKAAKQLGFYGDACVEAKLEIEALAVPGSDAATRMIDTFTQTECLNYFAAAGYDRD